MIKDLNEAQDSESILSSPLILECGKLTPLFKGMQNFSHGNAKKYDEYSAKAENQETRIIEILRKDLEGKTEQEIRAYIESFFEYCDTNHCLPSLFDMELSPLLFKESIKIFFSEFLGTESNTGKQENKSLFLKDKKNDTLSPLLIKECENIVPLLEEIQNHRIVSAKKHDECSRKIKEQETKIIGVLRNDLKGKTKLEIYNSLSAFLKYCNKIHYDPSFFAIKLNPLSHKESMIRLLSEFLGTTPNNEIANTREETVSSTDNVLNENDFEKPIQ